MWTLAYLIPLVWAVQGILSAMLVRKFARGFERAKRPAYAEYRPAVALIVPFKGAELGLAEHVHRLLTQDYPQYRLLLVVESEADPAAAVLREVGSQHADVRSEIVVAGLAGPDEGQKVHNLRAAVAKLEAEGMPVEVLAFADSDAAPDAKWLGNLVGPLVDERTGVTTGYRWFVPAEGERASLPTLLASIINSTVACWAGRERYNHAWGGSMAMRVSTAREGDLLGLWRGALSDDYQVSRMCKSLGKRIYFLHSCLVASPASFTWASLFEFGRRQYVITRTHALRLYVGGLFLTTLYAVGFVWTLASFLGGLIANFGGLGWLVPGIAIVVSGAASDLRGHYREQAVRHAFGEATVQRLRPALRIDAWLPMLPMLVHWAIILSAMFGRTITWRGNRYRIDGPQRIQKL